MHCNLEYSRVSVIRISRGIKINPTYIFFELYNIPQTNLKTLEGRKKISVIETRQY